MNIGLSLTIRNTKTVEMHSYKFCYWSWSHHFGSIYTKRHVIENLPIFVFGVMIKFHLVDFVIIEMQTYHSAIMIVA